MDFIEFNFDYILDLDFLLEVPSFDFDELVKNDLEVLNNLISSDFENI